MRESREAPLWDVPMRTKFDLRAAAGVARLVRQHGFRILHAHTVRTALVAAWRRGPRPACRWCITPTAPRRTIPRGGWRDAINGVVERLSLRRAARVIAVSRAMAEDMGARRLRPAANRGGAQRRAAAGRACRRRRSPGGRWTLGMVALFRPRKGIEVLLDAMAMSARRGVPVRLRAVGTFESPAYESRNRRPAPPAAIGRPRHWTGFTRDVTAELLKMDLFVLPSLFGEGLPMVVLEAMAAGVPVVATRVAGTPEAIRHGRDGLVVEPGDAARLGRGHRRRGRGPAGLGGDAPQRDRASGRLFLRSRHGPGVAAVYNELLQ